MGGRIRSGGELDDGMRAECMQDVLRVLFCGKDRDARHPSSRADSQQRFYPSIPTTMILATRHRKERNNSASGTHHGSPMKRLPISQPSPSAEAEGVDKGEEIASRPDAGTGLIDNSGNHDDSDATSGATSHITQRGMRHDHNSSAQLMVAGVQRACRLGKKQRSWARPDWVQEARVLYDLCKMGRQYFLCRKSGQQREFPASTADVQEGTKP
jgi:hypothetical protein